MQACLSCGNVACGRYIAEHALQHYHETMHPLSMEVNDKYVFWYVYHYITFHQNYVFLLN